MTKTHRTVWRTATTNRDLLEHDTQRGVIRVPVLELNPTELEELHQAAAELLAELKTTPLRPTQLGGAQ